MPDAVPRNSWLDWRPPRGGIAFLGGCFIFASIAIIVVGGDSWYTRWVGPFFLPVGVGLWLKHSWARWLTFAFFLTLALLLAIIVIDQGFTVRRILQGLIIAGSLSALWEWKVYPEDDEQAEVQ